MIETVLFGLGRFGRDHLAAWEATGRARVAAIVDPMYSGTSTPSPDGERQIPVVQDFSDLPASIPIDVAAVVTPVWTHREIAQSLFERSIPCVIEKPLAASSAEASQISEAARESGVVCMPGHIMRFSQPHLEIWQSLANLAHPVVTMSFRRDRSMALLELYPGEHPALLTGIHDIDLATWFANSPVGSVSSRHKIKDGVCVGFDANLYHRNGSESHISGEYRFPAELVDEVSDEVLVTGASGTTLGRFRDHSDSTPTPNSPDPALVSEICHFLDVYEGVTADLRVNLDDAVHCLAVVEAIINSSESEGQTLLVEAR
jgi:predicted dehydrogenase